MMIDAGKTGLLGDRMTLAGIGEVKTDNGIVIRIDDASLNFGGVNALSYVSLDGRSRIRHGELSIQVIVPIGAILYSYLRATVGWV
jgi:hypothetical protein